MSGGGERRGQSGGVSDEVSDAAAIVRGAPPLVSAPSFAREITDLHRIATFAACNDQNRHVAVIMSRISHFLGSSVAVSRNPRKYGGGGM